MWVSKAKWATTIAKALMKGYFLGVEEERKKQLSSGVSKQQRAGGKSIKVLKV